MRQIAMQDRERIEILARAMLAVIKRLPDTSDYEWFDAELAEIESEVKSLVSSTEVKADE